MTNRIVVTVACPDNIRMDRMRMLGTLVAAEVRKGLQKLEDEGALEKSELLLGSPGYTLILGMQEVKG